MGSGKMTVKVNVSFGLVWFPTRHKLGSSGKRGISTENPPLSDWPVGKSLGHFLND